MTLRKAFRIALATRFLILPFVTFFGSILADMARNLARGGAYDDHEEQDTDDHSLVGHDLRFFSLTEHVMPPKSQRGYQSIIQALDDDYYPTK